MYKTEFRLGTCLTKTVEGVKSKKKTMITYKRIVETMPRIDAKEFSHLPLKYLQNAIRIEPNLTKSHTTRETFLKGNT